MQNSISVILINSEHAQQLKTEPVNVVLVGTHANMLLGEITYFKSGVIGDWDHWSHHANTNILIPYLKGKK